MKMKKKYIWSGLIIAILIFISIPVVHILKTKWNETPVSYTTPVGYSNDASFLNLTKVDTVIHVSTSKEGIQDQLKTLLAYARQHHLKISIAGAQHSMGGHTISPDGIVLDMLPYKHMELDTVRDILTIGSGALWEDALRFLDTYGKSIAIMQAFSTFSVGGSLSVNGHGWQKNLPPLSSSVVSFTLLNSEGEILNCSREENPELFKGTLGGYGLFGVILDVKLKVVENSDLVFKYVHLRTENYLKYYNQFITENDKTELVFGRLRISDKQFLEEATLNFFERTAKKPTPLAEGSSIETKRLIFRGSVDSEYGKRLRWDLETSMNKVSKGAHFSRNKLLNDHVSLIENQDTASTDILHEYFIPERNFNQFIQVIKPVLFKSKIDLLNITIRRVEKDQDTYLNYAKETMYGFVILFNQKKTESQELAMKQLTNLLVDITIKYKGTFYLPYRLHVDREKMRVVYPQADVFFQHKIKYDPEEIFSNQFYTHYK